MVDVSRALPEGDGPAASGDAEVTVNEGLKLRVEVPAPEVRVVRVAGEVDLLTSSQLASCLNGELAQHPAYLILDLADVSYFGSTGLQVLVEARAGAAGHCQLWLTGSTAAVVRRPLEWTGLLPLFTCYDTVDQALLELG